MSDPRRPHPHAGPPRHHGAPHPAQGRHVPRPSEPEAAPTGPNPVRPELAEESGRDGRSGGSSGGRKPAPKTGSAKPGAKKSQKRPGAGKRRSRLFFGAAAALLALACVAVVAVLALRPSEKTAGRTADGGVRLGVPELTGFSPGTYSSSPSTDVFAQIETRELDPEPLTADEMFPKGSLSDETTGAEIVRRSSVEDADCADAIWGKGLAEALGKAGCSQAVRGLYTDPKKGFAAVVAVYNLTDAEAAGDAVEAFGAGSGGFVRVPDGAPKLFGEGFSMARGIAMGHYALIAWVQRTDGTGDGRSAALLSVLVTAAEADALYGRAA
ncbi:hypothetical protein EDD29_1524 [Actinocorallia herbida]|uniref:Uncharacterized protein n=1 Tax=Actinocorallia herbida TaxID=58109 RepID=A0A3N1CRS1_9ACTN|nr:hypothetical protein [Actinocorallia herbida]ROO84013.1 hypothetical protein EDD29_1524 [Actinocorallia herbida]